MKAFLKIAMVLAIVSSCAPKAEDPALTALKNKICGLVGEDAKIRVYSFEKIDSTTFGQELDYRIEVMNARYKQNMKLYDKYISENKSNNAALKLDVAKKTSTVIKGLEGLKESMGDKLDEVAYYDYKFSGKAEGGESYLDFPEAYATITPEGEVMTLETELKKLHKTMGRVIPGYMEIVKGEEE